MAAPQIYFPITTLMDQINSPMIYTDTPTRPLWGSNIGFTLTNFYTSSLQTATSKQYYYEIWASASLTCDDERMFAVAYGNISGSGSLYDADDLSLTGDTPTRAIYNQHRLLCLDGDEVGLLLSGSRATELLTNTPLEHFYAVSINRDKFGDKLDPGNFQLNVAELSGSYVEMQYHTGSNVRVKPAGKLIHLIDDSGDISNNALEYNELVDSPASVSKPRAIVSGTLSNGIYNNGASINGGREIYGVVYPSLGLMLLSADVLNKSASFNSFTASNANGDNAHKLFTSISGAYAAHTSGFQARSIDVKKSQQYYISVMPTSEGFGTSNPTWVLPPGSEDPYSPGKTVTGLIKYSDMRWKGSTTTGIPGQTVIYVTSIGLYDDSKNLLAIAKLSEPIKHENNDMLSVTVKLEY
jgi:hypothetical protein